MSFEIGSLAAGAMRGGEARRCAAARAALASRAGGRSVRYERARLPRPSGKRKGARSDEERTDLPLPTYRYDLNNELNSLRSRQTPPWAREHAAKERRLLQMGACVQEVCV